MNTESPALPQSIEAERALLGAILLYPKKIYDALEVRICPEVFYVPAHQLVFEAMLNVHRRGLPVDCIQVVDVLRTMEKLDLAGGAAEVVALADQHCFPERLEFYARIILEKSVLREVSLKLRELSSAAIATTNTEEFFVKLQAEILNCIPNALSRRKEVLADVMFRELERMQEAKKEQDGILTGFRDFDQMTQGLRRGKLVIVAGRPSMGKSSFATSILQNITDKDFSGIVFSQEMSNEEVAHRVLSGITGIPGQMFQNGPLSGDHQERAISAFSRFSQFRKLEVCDSTDITVVEIKALCQKKAIRDKKLDLVVIDYLGLLRPTHAYQTREREISEMSRQLKNLATELRVPVLVVSQLNRASEGRGDKKPMLSDLRDSGSVEQDADIVCLIYRDDYYNPDSQEKGIAELNIAKNRQGRTGTVKLKWIPELTLFRDLSKY